MVEKQLDELTPVQAKRFAIQIVQSELRTRGLDSTGFAVNAVVDEVLKNAKTKVVIREKAKEAADRAEAVAIGADYNRKTAELNKRIGHLSELKKVRTELKAVAEGTIDDLKEGRTDASAASAAFQNVLDKLDGNAKESKLPESSFSLGNLKLKKAFLHAMKGYLVKSNPEFAGANEVFQKLHGKADKSADETAALEKATRKMEETLERESRGILKFSKYA